jgi:hypothetical protein
MPLFSHARRCVDGLVGIDAPRGWSRPTQPMFVPRISASSGDHQFHPTEMGSSLGQHHVPIEGDRGCGIPGYTDRVASLTHGRPGSWSSIEHVSVAVDRDRGRALDDGY